MVNDQSPCEGETSGEKRAALRTDLGKAPGEAGSGGGRRQPRTDRSTEGDGPDPAESANEGEILSCSKSSSVVIFSFPSY